MSRTLARAALDQMNGRPSLIEAGYARPNAAIPGLEVTSSGFMADLNELAASTPQIEQARADQHRVEIAAAYGMSYDPKDMNNKPFLFVDGYAIIPIHGMLVNRCSYSYSFATGYNFIRAQVAAASADTDVIGIIYDVNSRGGMVAGCAETAAIMRAASKAGGGKPSLAVVDHNCYSAAYMLSCAADEIAVTPTGGAGSIGVLLMHMDVSAALAEMGVKITFIFAGDHKVDGNMFEPLTTEVKADLQAEIDKLYGSFTGWVATCRAGKMTEKQVRDTQAQCYLAPDALSIGLIDSVATPDQALAKFFSDAEEEGEDIDQRANSGDDADTTQESSMTPDEIKAANVAAAAEAVKADRERRAAIMGLPEAEGRTKQADHLANNTDLTVEACKAILAAGAVEAKAAAPAPVATPVATPGADKDLLADAMDKTGGGPNAGGNGPAGGGAAGGGEQMTRGQQILAAQKKAGGGVSDKK